MHTLTKVAWFLNRSVAGVVAAALTGAFAALVIFCYTLATAKGVGPGSDLPGGLLWQLEMGTLFGAMFGAPSGILVMCLTRAKRAPWRSLPTLLVGTTAGIVIFGLPWGLLPGTVANATIANVMFIAGPTIGGLIATRFIPDFSPA